MNASKYKGGLTQNVGHTIINLHSVNSKYPAKLLYLFETIIC